jgi:hypothetical protein
VSATASIPVISQRRPTDSLSLIRELAAVRDPKAHAISYYCSAEPFAEKTHFETLAKICNVILPPFALPESVTVHYRKISIGL